jgi:hypothetical protein
MGSTCDNQIKYRKDEEEIEISKALLAEYSATLSTHPASDLGAVKPVDLGI